MATLKDLRVRIQSVKNTEQITKTMKMVAAAKVRKARANCENARPYAEKLQGVLTHLASLVDKNSGPLLLSGRAEVKNVLVLAIGSDKGLCGSLNSALAKQALAFIEQQKAAGRQVKVVSVGSKVRDLLKKHAEIATHYDNFGKDLNYAQAKTIADYLLSAMENEEADQINMFYSEFVSMVTQPPCNTVLAPFAAEEKASDEVTASVEYEPDEEAILKRLLPQNLAVQVYRGLLESNASEQAARMTAMDNATRNAGEMIKSLSIQYNRSRQAAITSELIEIISGAEAL